MLTEQEARELLLRLRDAIAGHLWPLYRLWGLILWLTRQQPDEWGQCPWCGYDDWESYMYKSPWFKATNGGTYYIPGEPTVHWAEGIQTCPRCRYEWFTQDSN